MDEDRQHASKNSPVITTSADVGEEEKARIARGFADGSAAVLPGEPHLFWLQQRLADQPEVPTGSREQEVPRQPWNEAPHNA